MTGPRVLEIEIIDPLRLDGAVLVPGEKLSIPFFDHSYSLTKSTKAIVALRQEGTGWRTEKIIVGHEKDDYQLNFTNELTTATMGVEELVEGLKLLYAYVQVNVNNDLNIYTRFNTVTLKVSPDKMKQAVKSNAFVSFMFSKWDFYRCFTSPLDFGFWTDLENKKKLLASRQPSTAVALVDSVSSPNPLFARFLEVDSMSRVVKDYSYYYDPTKHEFSKVYDFVPDSAFAFIDTASFEWLSNFGFNRNQLLTENYFGDNYFDTEQMSVPRFNSSKKIPLPIHSVMGVLYYYGSDTDTLTAQMKNGKFVGKFKYRSADRYYEMNFNAAGLPHGSFAEYNEEMGNLLHYEHFSEGLRSGHYLSTYEGGHLYQTGSYYSGTRIGEWLEYYDDFEGGKLKSKNNYTYRDNSIERIVAEEWQCPKLLSSRYIDSDNISRLHGFQIYYDTSGEKLSFQQWNQGCLLERRDWFRKTLTAGIETTAQGTLGSMWRDTVYYAQSEYKNNVPWSGTFLVGAHHFFLGSASGRSPHIRISIATYEEGVEVKNEIISDNRPDQLYIGDIVILNPRATDDMFRDQRKWRLFKKKKKYVSTCGGTIIEVPNEPKKKKK